MAAETCSRTAALLDGFDWIEARSIPGGNTAEQKTSSDRDAKCEEQYGKIKADI